MVKDFVKTICLQTTCLYLVKYIRYTVYSTEILCQVRIVCQVKSNNYLNTFLLIYMWITQKLVHILKMSKLKLLFPWKLILRDRLKEVIQRFLYGIGDYRGKLLGVGQ